MNNKVRATVIITIDLDLAYTDEDMTPVDRVHDALIVALPEGMTCEEILEWEPEP